MYLFLFVLEFVLLFFLARLLTKSLSQLLFNFTKSKNITVNLLFCLFFLGILIHELAHLLVAGILLVRTGDMELVPKINGEEVRLGSVSIAKTDPIRRAIIGVAPVLAGFAIIFGTLFYFQTLEVKSLILFILTGLIIFEVGNTMFSSKKDLEGTLELVIIAVFILCAIFFMRLDLVRVISIFLQDKEIVNLFRNADLFLIAPLAIDSLVISFVRLFISREG